MRIACPACNATYEVPDTEMRAERVVRCARCGTDWAPVGMTEPAEIPMSVPVPAMVEPEPEPEPEQGLQMALDEDRPLPAPVPMAPIPMSTPVVARRRPLVLVLAWVVSLLVVGGGIGALAMKRDRVMAMWPPSVRGYAALGLAGRP